MSRLEISLPNEKICLEFIKLNDDVKVKWLKIAKEMYNKSIETVQCMTDENHKQTIEVLNKKYNNKKNELELSLEGERELRRKMEDKHITNLKSIERSVSEKTKILYTEKNAAVCECPDGIPYDVGFLLLAIQPQSLASCGLSPLPNIGISFRPKICFNPNFKTLFNCSTKNNHTNKYNDSGFFVPIK